LDLMHSLIHLARSALTTVTSDDGDDGGVA
jgi:hypothetical protein